MALLTKKHSNRDFFILDIADVVPKDDIASMEHPIFSLSTKPDMRELKYENGGTVLKVIPSGHGLATIHDKDALIWAFSKIIHAKNRGEPYSRTVTGSAYDLLGATNRPTNNLAYDRLEQTFIRLSGTRFVSNIRTGGKMETRIFGLVEEASFSYDVDGTMRRDGISITLSEWLFRAIDALEVVTISEDYFRLRRPLERRIYEIARKHCGHSSKWAIDLARLQKKTGSNAPLKKFRFNVHQIIKDDHTPFYRLELLDNDLVIFRPRTTRRKVTENIMLPSWAEEKAREIARVKGWDYHALLSEWQGFAKSGEPPRDAGAAFVGFCNKKKSLRP